jgi:hypothetical protein
MINKKSEVLRTQHFPKLRLFQKYRIFNMTRTDTIYGPTILVIFEFSESEKCKIFFPKRFAIALSDREIDAYNMGGPKWSFIFKGIRDTAHDIEIVPSDSTEIESDPPTSM